MNNYDHVRSRIFEELLILDIFHSRFSTYISSNNLILFYLFSIKCDPNFLEKIDGIILSLEIMSHIC